MALPQKYTDRFTANEIAFQAENELINIIPSQSLNKIDFGDWQLPTLNARKSTSVPLWLALLLRKLNRCVIIFPDWLDQDQLQAVVDKERSDQSRFMPLPWFWQPLSRALFSLAAKDYQGNVDSARQLLQDLQEIRQVKIRAGMAQVDENHIQMDGLGYMEINTLRASLATTMNTLEKVTNN